MMYAHRSHSILHIHFSFQWKNYSSVGFGTWSTRRNCANNWFKCKGLQEGASQYEMLGYRYEVAISMGHLA